MKDSKAVMYIFFVTFLIIVACADKPQEKKKVQEAVTLEINLPTSISVNEAIEGYVVYSSEFETLKLKENERRYVFMYLTTTKEPFKNFQELKTIKLDTFVRIENNIIPIYDIEFIEKGSMYLDGYIIDQIYLDDGTDNVKVSTIETKVTHSINVEGDQRVM